MTHYNYDIFVIGAGSGGVRASRMSAALGARVAVAEDRFLGGTCVNIGCVPKKLMVYASHFREEFEDARGFGWTVGESAFDWPTLIANKDSEIRRLNGIYERLLKNAGVTIVDGRARVVGPHEVEVGGSRITAKHILVATGGKPRRTDEFVGHEHCLVSDDLFHLKTQPKRVLIVGGGYIAVEFAGIFNGLGSKVTQLYRDSLFLRGFDEDLRLFLAEEMPKKGVDLRFKTGIRAVEKRGRHYHVAMSDDTTGEYDAVVLAIGRDPNTADLGLEEAGVALTPRGAVMVDGDYRSSVPSILAIGDVTDRVQLTPVALAEGMVVARDLFGGVRSEFDYENIPSAVFSQPPLATVGLTEVEARLRYGEIDVYRSTFRPMKHTLSGRDEKSMMKLVVERAGQKVVGVHMGGVDAAEIVQGIAIAVKAGATKQVFDSTIGIHPTAAEEFVTMREKLPEPQRQAAE